MTNSAGFSFGPAPPAARPFRSGGPTRERPYDIARDAAPFVAAIGAGATVDGNTVEPVIQVVLNWFEELKQRAPAGR